MFLESQIRNAVIKLGSGNENLRGTIAGFWREKRDKWLDRMVGNLAKGEKFHKLDDVGGTDKVKTCRSG